MSIVIHTICKPMVLVQPQLMAPNSYYHENILDDVNNNEKWYSFFSTDKEIVGTKKMRVTEGRMRRTPFNETHYEQ